MLTRVLRTVRLDTIDRRSQVGCALRRLRDDLTDQFGGDVTAAQRILIEETAKLRVIAMAVGDYILKQETLVTSEQALLPVVTQYGALTAKLTGMLTALGLERREQAMPTLDSYLAARSSSPKKPSAESAKLTREGAEVGGTPGESTAESAKMPPPRAPSPTPTPVGSTP